MNSARGSLCEKYKLGEELGHGASGVARVCIDRITGEELACKKITKIEHLHQDEVGILKQLYGHPNIVKLEAAFSDEKETYLVMELCRGGSLFSNGSLLSEMEAAQLCKNLMEAVKFCHSNGIIHRDISLKNILLGDNCFKLADFGLAAHFQPGEYLSDLIGTLCYMAPEVFKRRYSKEIDIWSSGVVIFAILSGNFPFHGNTFKSTIHAIEAARIDFDPEYWSNASPSVKDLIRGMLHQDPRKRLTPEQVLDHDWVVHHTSDEARSSLATINTRRYFGSKSEKNSSSFSLSQVARDLIVCAKLILGLIPN
ncbi:hypothetical protein SELMODRAFT_99940 [Selaginella moellendorffii]|uniref:Protein kinase domain-containing protein n=1 Tax=Selaginella moellendorffii TaxID=88036 RepID=D8RR03_SELML|nr:hypothetical protein SELMODRAFT_99940 [Selaginella moellendorffii]